MFRQQKIILDALPVLRPLLARYAWQAEPANWLALAEAQAQKFVVPVPLVGAFSSGKSTLMNALIGQPLFSVEIDPETAVPAEVTYGDTERLSGCLPDGRRLPLTRDDIQNNRLSALKDGGWVEAVLPAPALVALPHLRLVDMPGWDSGIAAHGMAIDRYAVRSLAYAVVVSADEGSLRSSIHRALDELKLHQMPVLAIVTKADKKPADEVAAVLAQVTQEISSAMGRPPLQAVKVSARKNDLADLLAALTQLESQAEPLFAHNVARPLAQKLRSLHGHLDTLRNSDDLDSEKIKAECARLNADMQSFAVRLDDETRQLDARVQPVLGHIMQQLQARLSGQLDSLADLALHGGDLQGSIGATMRLVVEEGMRDEFNPEIERYLGRVAEGLPGHFSPEVMGSFQPETGNDTSEGQSLLANPLVALVLPALIKFIPSLQVIGPVVVGVVTLLEKLFNDKGQKQIEASRQEESVRNKLLREVIPSAISQVKAVLQPQLHQHIAQAKQKITADVQAQQASHQAALTQLQRQLEQGQAAFALACTGYQQDQAFLDGLLAQLDPAEAA